MCFEDGAALGKNVMPSKLVLHLGTKEKRVYNVL